MNPSGGTLESMVVDIVANQPLDASVLEVVGVQPEVMIE